MIAGSVRVAFQTGWIALQGQGDDYDFCMTNKVLQERWEDCLGSAAHLGPPPADAHQQKTLVLKKLWRFMLKGVANELQKPAKDEESGGEHPERMIENCGHGQRK